MSEWSKAKLKEVAKIVTGKTPSTSHKEYFGGEIPFVTPADLNNGILLETKTHLTHLGANQVYLVPENTVLVSCIGNLGKLAITSKDSCFNQQINGLIFDEQKIFPKYGFYFAQTLKPQLEKASSSTTKSPFAAAPLIKSIKVIVRLMDLCWSMKSSMKL